MNETLKVIITAEIDKLKSALKTGKDEVLSFQDQVVKASKDIDKNFKAVGKAISTGLKTAGVAISGATAGLLALTAKTSEYRQNQALLASAFETAGSSAEVAKETYNDLYRVLGDGGQATEAAQHLAKLTQEEKSLNEWTNICQGVYASFGASLPIESLTEAANETAKTGDLTGALADALNWAGIAEDDFQAKLDACNTEAEREQLIRSTLNGLYSEAATNYEANNAAVLAQNEAQAKLEGTMARVGEALAPVNTALTTLANDVLTALTPYIQSFAENYLPVIVEILGQAGTALETALNWMKEHEILLISIAAVIGTVVAAIGLYNAITAIKAAMDAAQVASIGGLIAAHAAQAVAAMAALAPYILWVAIIAGVIAIIVLAVKNWDWLKDTAKAVWEAVKKWTVEAAEKVKQKISEMVEKVVGFFTNLKEKVSSAVDTAKTAITTKFEEIKTGISEKVNAAKETAVNVFEAIKTGIATRIETAKTTVVNTVSNIYNSIKDKFTSAKNSVLSIFDNIKSGISDKISAAKETVGNMIEKIKGFFNFSWSLPKLKMPHISITGKFSLSPLQVPKFSISWNALGGVFDNPAIFGYGGSLQGIGENGAEAVVPLEKNLGWLDKLAGMLNERMGGNQPIVLQVDGKTFAQISCDSINALTRQRGSIPLNLA